MSDILPPDLEPSTNATIYAGLAFQFFGLSNLALALYRLTHGAELVAVIFLAASGILFQLAGWYVWSCKNRERHLKTHRLLAAGMLVIFSGFFSVGCIFFPWELANSSTGGGSSALAIGAKYFIGRCLTGVIALWALLGAVSNIRAAWTLTAKEQEPTPTLGRIRAEDRRRD